MNKLKFNFDIFLFAILLFFSSLLLWSSTGEFILNFRAIGFSIVSGIEKSVFYVNSFFKDTVTSVVELSSLKEKYAQLVEKLNKYEILETSTLEIQKENKELRELLGFSQNIRTHNIVAEIIALDPNNLYYGIVINKGLKQGIIKNMPVIAFQNGNMALVGKIISVGKSSSVVLPLYDDRCYIAAKMEGAKHRGIVGGQGSNSLPLVMRYVKKRVKDEIKVGDKVLTSGLDDMSVFPKNIPIGYISKIKMHDYETSLELSVEPIINFSILEYVFVLDISHNNKEKEEEKE
ncbi:MAG: rod shape-determining protein MreC [Treponema sp.]